MSAGVPHDTLTEERLAEVQQMADAPSDAYSAGEWCFALNMTLAELARVSREHETMRDALRELERYTHLCSLSPPGARPAKEHARAVLAGSRAATPEDADVWTCMTCGAIGERQSCGNCGAEARPGRWVRAATPEDA